MKAAPTLALLGLLGCKKHVDLPEVVEGPSYHKADPCYPAEAAREVLRGVTSTIEAGNLEVENSNTFHVNGSSTLFIETNWRGVEEIMLDGANVLLTNTELILQVDGANTKFRLHSNGRNLAGVMIEGENIWIVDPTCPL